MKILMPCLLIGLLAPTIALAAPRQVTDPDAPRALAGDGPVQVDWTDPAHFTELAHSGNRWEAARGNWVHDLASHLVDTANTRLPEGQQLAVTITDIDLAGDYEPWRGPRQTDIRMLRDIYPPRIRLQYTLRDAGGQVLDQQEAVLSDMGYLRSTASPRMRNQSLPYEKRMIDNWLHQLLPAANAQATARR